MTQSTFFVIDDTVDLHFGDEFNGEFRLLGRSST